MDLFEDGEKLLDNISKYKTEDPTIYDKIKSYYSQKNYLLNHNSKIERTERNAEGYDLDVTFNRSSNINSDIIELINKSVGMTITPKLLEIYFNPILDKLDGDKKLNVHHKYLLEMTLLKYPLDYLKNLLNSSLDVEINKFLNIDGVTINNIIGLYRLYSKWLLVLKDNPLINIYKYTFMIIFNIYIEKCKELQISEEGETIFSYKKYSKIIDENSYNVNIDFMKSIIDIPINNSDILEDIDYIKSKLNLIKCWFNTECQFTTILNFIDKYVNNSEFQTIETYLGGIFKTECIKLNEESAEDKVLKNRVDRNKMNIINFNHVKKLQEEYNKIKEIKNIGTDTEPTININKYEIDKITELFKITTNKLNYNNELILPNISELNRVLEESESQIKIKLVMSILLQFIYSCKMKNYYFYNYTNEEKTVKHYYLYNLPYKNLEIKYQNTYSLVKKIFINREFKDILTINEDNVETFTKDKEYIRTYNNLYKEKANKVVASLTTKISKYTDLLAKELEKQDDIKKMYKYGYDCFVLDYDYVDNLFIENVNISKDKVLPLMSSYNYDSDTLTSLIRFIDTEDVQFLEKSVFHKYFNYGVVEELSQIKPIYNTTSELFDLDTQNKYLDIIFTKDKL